VPARHSTRDLDPAEDPQRLGLTYQSLYMAAKLKRIALTGWGKQVKDHVTRLFLGIISLKTYTTLDCGFAIPEEWRFRPLYMGIKQIVIGHDI
jgi:hypothetical protein